MNELQPAENAVTWQQQPLQNGRLTILRPAGDHTGFSLKQSAAAGNDQTLHAFYLYDRQDNYKVLYALLDATGNITQVLHEQEGILPALFHAPGGELWASVSPYHPDKELETFLPVFNRSAAAPLKPGRPFPADFVGAIEKTVISWNEDPFSDKKPDKVQLLHFEEGAIVKKSDFKVEMPKSNKPFITNGQLHLFHQEPEDILHRVMDLKGNILASHSFPFAFDHFQPLSASPEGAVSLFYMNEDGAIGIFDVPAQGAGSATSLLTTDLDFYSTWPPVWLDQNTFLVKFTHEEGNGWLVIRHRTMVECFVQGKTGGVYSDLVSGNDLRLHNKALVLSDAARQTEGSYTISFYPEPGKSQKNEKAILLLQRQAGAAAQ